ncbi:MAG: TonB-dependent receptor [Pseudomonadota bacterium]
MVRKSIVAATAAVCTTSVLAQTSGDEGFVVDEIIVEGELQDRTLQETQTSVTVVTGEELERRSDTSLRSVAERTAGVSTSSRGIGFVIRGFDERGVDQNGPSAPAITTSVDGVRITDFGRINTTFLSTWDLEQVEFLRGPQSTQTGRNALAGAVVVRSRDPSFDEEFKLRTVAGNFGTFQAAVAANYPIIEDTLAARFSAELNTTNGFITNITTGANDEGGTENMTLRGSLRFEPTEDFSAVLKLSYIDGTDGFASSFSQFEPSRIVDTNEITEDDFEYRTANLRLTYDFSDELTLETETVYSNRQFVFRGDFDSGPQALAFAVDADRDSSFSQEVRLNYEDERFSGVFGAFYNQTRGSSTTGGVVLSTFIAPPQFVPFLQPNSSIDTEAFSTLQSQNFALFGEVEAEVFGGLSLIVGGRYDRERQTSSNISMASTNDPLVQSLLPANEITPTDTLFQAFLPKAGVVYDFTDDVSLGFTFQRGYRAGGAAFSVVRGEQFEFDPEFSNNYELSFRSQWFDDRLTVNANAYYVTYRDQQVVIPLSNQPLDVQTVNAGESQSFGGELEVRARPIDELELYGSLGYNETEFTDFVSDGIQLAGNEFRSAPRFTGGVGGTYFFDNGLFLGADASYTSASFRDAFNDPALRSDSRFLLNLRGGFEIENFTVTAFVNNVTDVTYAEERDPGSVTLGAPLTFGAIGQVEF